MRRRGETGAGRGRWGRAPSRTAPPPELRRLRIAVVGFFTVLLIGFFGYQLIEGVSPLDSLYMTIITVTTVGFREIVEPSTAGKVLTIGLIAAGVGSASYAAVTAAEFVVEGHLGRFIERRRMQREIAELDRHVVICGFGRVGRHLADALADDGAPFVVIENDPGKLAELEALEYHHVEGDATQEQVMHDAGIERARAVAAAVHGDADNVLVTLTAKGLNPGAVMIARAKADETEEKLRRAGADRVILPATIGGKRIAQILTRPVVADFLDGIGAGATDYTLEEVPIEVGSELAGETLREAAIRDRYGCSVLAIRHGEGDRLDTHPSADTVLEPGDVIVVVGSDDEVVAMRRRFTDG
ncbi:MAG: potassium channel protein [Nitriliruptorales bacterium]|nr:potassium channel protein [Nitriliruptorales bacterium]